MTKNKMKNVVPVSIHRVRQPRVGKTGTQPRVIKVSSNLKMSPSIVDPIPSATLQNSKLRCNLSLAHHREQEIVKQNEALVTENAELQAEVVRLTQFLLQKDEEHHIELRESKTQSHQEGLHAAAKEMHTLWSSHEFAAELMYGKCDCCKLS